MVGIARYGAYVPVTRLDRRLIEAAWGTRQPKGEIAVANYDEDALTLAIDAAMSCLGDSPPAAICRAPSSQRILPARRARGSVRSSPACARCRPRPRPRCSSQLLTSA